MTPTSVRRALDSGRTGTDLAAMFAQRSRTPVPQALSYLIDDLARRHGMLRSGTAASYLRCEDEALLARVVADRAVASLQLRKIAPTVVVSTTPVARVLDVLARGRLRAGRRGAGRRGHRARRRPAARPVASAGACRAVAQHAKPRSASW